MISLIDYINESILDRAPAIDKKTLAGMKKIANDWLKTNFSKRGGRVKLVQEGEYFIAEYSGSPGIYCSNCPEYLRFKIDADSIYFYDYEEGFLNKIESKSKGIDISIYSSNSASAIGEVNNNLKIKTMYVSSENVNQISDFSSLSNNKLEKLTIGIISNTSLNLDGLKIDTLNLTASSSNKYKVDIKGHCSVNNLISDVYKLNGAPSNLKMLWDCTGGVITSGDVKSVDTLKVFDIKPDHVEYLMSNGTDCIPDYKKIDKGNIVSPAAKVPKSLLGILFAITAITRKIDSYPKFNPGGDENMDSIIKTSGYELYLAGDEDNRIKEVSSTKNSKNKRNIYCIVSNGRLLGLYFPKDYDNIRVFGKLYTKDEKLMNLASKYDQ